MSEWKPTLPPFVEFKKKTLQQIALASEFIYQIGESDLLRTPSEDVSLEAITGSVSKAKIAYVKSCLLQYREITGYGRGITAVQVGIPDRFSVIFTPEKEILTIINPTVISVSDRNLVYPEMCMSAAPIVVPTIRPSWIEFDYYDEDGKLQQWRMKDDSEIGLMMNRVFQHEIDHMDGIVNVDKVKDPRSLILESDPSFYDNAQFEEIK